GSLLCGLAPSTEWLIAARALQGIGATMLNPVAMAIIVNTFTEPTQRARAIGVFASMSGFALALGPVLGGGLVDAFGWQAIFLINVPIIGTAIVAAVLLVPESRAARPRRFDPIGQTLVVTLLGSVVYAVIESRQLGWNSPVIVGLLAIATLSVAAIVAYECRRSDPLLELRLFRSAPFAAALVMVLCALIAFGAYLFTTTLYLQDVRDMSALAAGLTLLPVGALVMLLSPLSGRIVGARGTRIPLIVSGVALVAAGAASLRLTPTTPLAYVLAVAVLIGIFFGLVNPPITNTAVTGMPRSMAGLAGSLASVGRQTGTTVGVAIAGTLLGPKLTGDATGFTTTAHALWWMLICMGVALILLTLLSTGAWAKATAAHTATLFTELEPRSFQQPGDVERAPT
ncbi:MAG: MFS transporter, partial [Actinomycetia bacterium]|nr:MFS transporter [Actinomycetes bacterium]